MKKLIFVLIICGLFFTSPIVAQIEEALKKHAQKEACFFAIQNRFFAADSTFIACFNAIKYQSQCLPCLQQLDPSLDSLNYLLFFYQSFGDKIEAIDQKTGVKMTATGSKFTVQEALSFQTLLGKFQDAVKKAMEAISAKKNADAELKAVFFFEGIVVKYWNENVSQ